MFVVSNSSPLIALTAIGQLDLLPALFEAVLIPPAVAVEIAASIPTLPGWLRVQDLKQALPSAVVRPSLGDGERETLALALEIQADLSILDDLPARRVARTLGLDITGTAGVLLAAKRRGLIPHVRPHLENLVNNAFFIGPELFEELLELAGEQDSV